MSRMFYRICESMYCSIVRVRVWTALCVFKTFVLPWQRLRKKFKSMWLSQLENLFSNLLKISQNSEKVTPHPSQLRPLKFIYRRPQNLRNLHQLFVLCTASQIIGGDFTKFCGLLRIYKLYVYYFFSGLW